MKRCVSIAAAIWICLATISLVAASLPSPTEILQKGMDGLLADLEIKVNQTSSGVSARPVANGLPTH